jgi:hypothetical protein
MYSEFPQIINRSPPENAANKSPLFCTSHCEIWVAHTMHLEVPPEDISPFLDQVKAKTRTLYIVGVICYKDISKQFTGRTEFCLYLIPDRQDLAFCGTHNDMK